MSIPKSAPAHNDLGFILLERGDVKGALDRFREAASLDPRLPDAHYNLGRTLRRSGGFAEAVEHFRRAVDLLPGVATGAGQSGVAPRDGASERASIDRHRRCARRACCLRFPRAATRLCWTS